MQEDAYRAWLEASQTDSGSLSTLLSTARRIEAAYGELDKAFKEDGFDAILSELAYSTTDRSNNAPNPSKLIINGDIYAGLASARTRLNNYRRFMETQSTIAAVTEAVQSKVNAGVDPDEVPEAVLSLERDLNAALRQNISQLEPGLTVIDGGKERKVASGFIDILCEDALGRKVVIELKAVKAPRDAVAQVLAYMGDISDEADADVRGMLIAPDFDPKALSAARMVPSLELKRFTFKFSFEPVGKPE